MNTQHTPPLVSGKTITGTNKKSERVYRIKKVLGRGGFGITYLAESTLYDGNIPQQVNYTIKEFCLSDICSRAEDGTISVPEAKLTEYEEAKKDFLREAERLQQMKHEGIVPVNEVFETNGTAYYVMQYLGETSLKQYVKDQGGSLDEDEARRVIAKMAAALEYIHQKKVTHLDVKPENAMMVPGRDGRLNPVLIDFGLAVHYKSDGSMTSRHGMTGVTDGYSPLEQYAGIERFAPEADIYALGATFYFLLTGKAPVKAANMSMQVLYSSLPDGLQDATVDALRNAMQKLPEKRTKSISAFLADLDYDTVSSSDEQWDPNATRRRVKRDNPNKSAPDYRKLGLYGGIALAVVAVVVLLVVLLGGKSTSESDDDRMSEEQTEELDSLSEEIVGEDTTAVDSVAHVDEPDAVSAATPTSTQQAASQPVQTAQPVQQVPQKEPDYVKLKYGEWFGPVTNGKPDGEGVMVFHSSHLIRGGYPYRAEPGDKVRGYYSNGQLEYGTWIKSDGSSEQLMIGG